MEASFIILMAAKCFQVCGQGERTHIFPVFGVVVHVKKLSLWEMTITINDYYYNLYLFFNEKHIAAWNPNFRNQDTITMYFKNNIQYIFC